MLKKKKTSPRRKITSKFDMTNPVYMSFLLAFLALSGTTVITFLASFTEEAERYRYLKGALVSETCVNVIAGFTYIYFMRYLYDSNITLSNVTPLRYIDWFLTTPFLLLSFALFSSYSYEKNETVDMIPLIYIIALNWGMLVCGGLGETKKLNSGTAFILGFGFYSGLMYLLYDKYVKGKGEENEVLFIVFAIIWGLYGVSYLLPLEWKNISYNILDTISKSGFGVFIWFNVLVKGAGPVAKLTTTTP